MEADQADDGKRSVRYCPACHTETDDPSATSCSKCGTPLTTVVTGNKPDSPSWAYVVIAAVVLMGVAVFCVGAYTGGDDPATPRDLGTWACHNLDEGIPPSQVGASLGREARAQGVDVEDALSEVRRQCPELLD